MYLKRKRGRTSFKGKTCNTLPAVRSSCRSPRLVECYNGSFQAGSKPPEVTASWTVWNLRTATPSTLRRTHQRAKGALTGCIYGL